MSMGLGVDGVTGRFDTRVIRQMELKALMEEEEERRKDGGIV